MLPVLFGENLFDDFFDDSFEREFRALNHNPLYGKHGRNLMKTDVRENGDQYELAVDLPGFSKDEIQVDLKDGILTITAAHQEHSDQKDGKGSYIRRERRYGCFTRSFDITGIDETAITAAYKSGILELTLPKTVPAVPESRRIAIE